MRSKPKVFAVAAIILVPAAAIGAGAAYVAVILWQAATNIFEILVRSL